MDVQPIEQQFRMLIIDDNPEIHKDFNKILAFSRPGSEKMTEDELLLFDKTDKIFHAPGYLIDSAYQGEEGLALVEKSLEEDQPYAVMFVDIRMPPGWDGIETIQKIWSVDSEIQTVICTAYSDYSWEDIYKKVGETDRLLILKKPFDNIEVRQFASALAKKWLLAKQVGQQLDFLQKTVDEKTVELRNTLSLLRASFEATADGILVVSKRNEIVDWNKKFCELWNVPDVIMESRKFSNLIALIVNQLEHPGTFLKIIQGLENGSPKKSFDFLKFKNKKIFESYSQPQESNGEIIGRVWSFRDITERRSLEEKLAYQASHDVLTGLLNRSLFLKKVEQGLKEAAQEKKHAAVIFFDLDRFKLINDSLGHLLGDKLLKIMAARFEQCTRPHDALARLGGDEFVVFISSISSDAEITGIIQRFFNMAGRPFDVDGNVLNVTLSGGISVYPKDGELAEVLLKNADAAMYRAKELGRNNFQYYTSGMNTQSAEQLLLANELNDALKNKELLLYYQPLLDVKNKKIIGVEALIRWQHPKRGLLAPIEFLPVAEETGLIIPIGEWVLIEACKQVKAWHDSGLSDIWLAVNLSPTQFKRGDIISTVEKALTESGLESKYLCLEITENLMLEDNTNLRKTLTNLKMKGITLAIDDFGVGYSNLSYITRFPIDKLKIDKSFIRDVVSDLSEASVVLAILGIARGLNMQVLAEGVETKEQLKFLQENQCDEFQGFLVSKPVDSKACEDILRRGSEMEE